MFQLTHGSRVALKGALVLIILAGLVGQLLSHRFAAAIAAPLPPEDFPSALYASLTVVAILNVQTIAYYLWRLLDPPHETSDPGAEHLHRLRVITRTGILAAVPLAIMLVHVVVSYGLGSPALVTVLSVALVMTGLFIVLMVIVRHVFSAALGMQSELDVVI